MIRYYVVLLAACVVQGPVFAQSPEAPKKKVLIIGLDGCRPDALKKARTPNLNELIRNGAFSDKAQTSAQTISGAGWSSMLCGVWPDKHKVPGNDFKANNYKEYPHFFCRLKEAQPKANTVSISHWAPINKHIVMDCDLVSSPKTGAAVAEEACDVLRNKNPDVVFTHIDDIDGAGHKFGFSPDVPQYIQEIEKADILIGVMLKAMRNRKTYAQEDWLVLVSTDHGGSGKAHGKNIPEHRTIFLIVSGPSAMQGATIEPAPGVVDVAVTALVHLGVPVHEKWKLDGKAVGLKNR
ncbi:MAG TPA: alkaline phosphatase family protein [Gemmataceae bacterium]|nr:alkaline phosphatase family protein [Gemmataceae bacterium]